MPHVTGLETTAGRAHVAAPRCCQDIEGPGQARLRSWLCCFVSVVIRSRCPHARRTACGMCQRFSGVQSRVDGRTWWRETCSPRAVRCKCNSKSSRCFMRARASHALLVSAGHLRCRQWRLRRVWLDGPCGGGRPQIAHSVDFPTLMAGLQQCFFCRSKRVLLFGPRAIDWISIERVAVPSALASCHAHVNDSTCRRRCFRPPLPLAPPTAVFLFGIVA